MTRHFDSANAPHLGAPRSVQGLMLRVLLALLPALVVQTIYFGVGLLLQLLLCVLFALGLEAAMLRLRRVPSGAFLRDLSAPLTAVLFVLCIPPLVPWWVGLVGMIAAIVFAKHLYGGLGFNLFNPAMVAYAVVLLCFPLALSQWPSTVMGSGTADLATALSSLLGQTESIDAVAGATALDSLRNLRGQGLSLGEILQQPAFDPDGMGHRLWLAFAYTLGGTYLLFARLIPWQVPFAVLGSMLLFALPGWLLDPDQFASPWFHLVSGASLLGAFFIATDPVSGCTTPRGRLLFGAGVGLLCMCIRYWGNYPDGLAFAVLIMNAAAPWIDLHTRPRILGEGQPREH